MPMNSTDVVDLVTHTLLPLYLAERDRLERIDVWYRWQHEDVRTPTAATAELRALVELAKTPWLSLVVTNVAQAMRVDGYRTPDARDDNPSWRLWQANGLGRRQGAVHRAMLAYGCSYATASPGVDDLTGAPMAVLRGVSPRKMMAFYRNPAEDDWPIYALRSVGPNTWWLYDAEAIYVLGPAPDGTPPRLLVTDVRMQTAGVCPVVRFTNMLDLDGRTVGEIEPVIPLAKRINKTTYDRLMIQHFNSWKVRTVAGMAEPDSDEDAVRAKLKLRHDDLLVAEDPDTKFGTLPETPLDGMIRAYETDIKTLAAATQTPVHALTGDMINLSAEALAAARAELDAKSAECKLSAGESWAQLLRLGAHIDGDTEAASDVMAEVTWADTSVRSLASAADALGKMATMLGVPVQALWSRIPGVSKTDVEEWRAMLVDGDPFAQLGDMLDRQAGDPAGAMVTAADPETVKAQADAMGVLIRSGVEPHDAAVAVGLGQIRFTGAVPVSLRIPQADAAVLEDA
jgi:RES domain-containing protein